MSLASDYATAYGAVKASEPITWTGPGGLMTASVDNDGNGSLNLQGSIFTVPGAVLLSFSTWISTTFT